MLAYQKQPYDLLNIFLILLNFSITYIILLIYYLTSIFLINFLNIIFVQPISIFMNYKIP